ncbi:hypothetical protein HD554DRAFT_696884 [Boletus coccyginus]|nr:hypothetical protein HD554DRAFT_696884 [Boletus coccyginus]
MAHSTLQQPQEIQVHPGSVTHDNQPVAVPHTFSAGNGASPMPAQSQGFLNQQISIQPMQIERLNITPPRAGGTPREISGGQLPNPMPPDQGNFGVQSGQKVSDHWQAGQMAAGIVLLDKSRFDSTYAHFCRIQNTNPASCVPMGDRTEDLHRLHVYVMHEGGAASVNQRDLWAVIGGRLGFIQFPGDDSEPARSDPGIA